MTVEQAVLEYILADGAASTAIGGRLWLHQRAQGSAYPCGRVLLVADADSYHLRGASNALRALVQVDIWAEDAGASDPYAAAAAAAAAVNAAISGKRWSSGALEITGCQREQRRALYDPDELRLVRISQDFAVWYRAA